MPVLSDAALRRDQAFIDGRWVEAADGRTTPVVNPATGAVMGTVPLLGAAETRQAIAAAARAQPDWAARSAKERAAVLRRWADLMLTHQDDLARLMTAEQGKPLPEARGEIAYAASFLEWFGEEAKRIYGDVIPATKPGQRVLTLKQPIGVCAAITPWNFPSAMITRKAGPALAAGCSIVIKPAPQTPWSALALVELATRAGVPAGVINVVTGDAEAIGGELCAHPTVRKLSFTGSTAVGKKLMAQCADTVKKLSLELGGHAPFIVFDDADLDAAIDGALASKYRNAGQTCVCANRIMVQAGIYDAFIEKFAAAVARLKVGDGAEPGVAVGPLINAAAMAKVERHVADAVAKGGEIVLGGARHGLGGTFYQPTLIAKATPDMLIAREETFGPVAPVFKFTTEAEAIRFANDTEYGLAAYLFSRDLGRVWRMAEALDYGIVGVNEGIISSEVAPFGGMKQSGFGREGSKYGMDEYLEIKYVLMGGLNR